MKDEYKDNCSGCGVPVGAQCLDGCDATRCKYTGEQYAQCYYDHDRKAYYSANGLQHDTCVPCTYKGYWPGVIECQEYDLWNYFVPYGNPSWQKCDGDHPEATEALTDLFLMYAHGELVWSPSQERLVKPDDNSIQGRFTISV